MHHTQYTHTQHATYSTYATYGHMRIICTFEGSNWLQNVGSSELENHLGIVGLGSAMFVIYVVLGIEPLSATKCGAYVYFIPSLYANTSYPINTK